MRLWWPGAGSNYLPSDFRSEFDIGFANGLPAVHGGLLPVTSSSSSLTCSGRRSRAADAIRLSHPSLPGGRSRLSLAKWWRPGLVPWVVKTRGPPGSRQAKREDADSTVESSLSDQISDRDTARPGGKSGIPGAGQDNRRRRNGTNRMRRQARLARTASSSCLRRLRSGTVAARRSV